MNKYFKKGIAIVLMLSIIITSQRFTVFAGVSNNISKDIEIERVDKTVYKDIQLMKKIGISSNEDNPLKLVNLSKKSYCVDDSTIIQIIENSDKRIELRITEGNKVDNVVFTNDGKTYLDNKQVIVTDSEGNEILHNMFAEPKVGYSIYYKKTCPYGSSGDYTHYYGQEKSANISLGKDITALSVVAFRAFMLTYLGVAGEAGVCARAGDQSGSYWRRRAGGLARRGICRIWQRSARGLFRSDHPDCGAQQWKHRLLHPD